MNPSASSLTLQSQTRRGTLGGALDGLCKAGLFSKLARVQKGRIVLRDGGDIRVFGEKRAAEDLSACLTVHHPRFYSCAAAGGSIGAGESYAAGDWECDDLTALVRIFVANRDILTSLDGGWGAVLQPLERFVHNSRRNTVEKARDNIRAHYDLGNDFFRLFLDDTMMYSCGIFKDEGSSLREASMEKNDRICRKLALSPRDHVLEIGTGWGGFALHAAKNYGCRVTTATISRAQFDWAQTRVREAGLQNRIEILLEDYRHLKGSYDKLVSIEMVEAVGLDHLETYFKTCAQRLSPHGTMLLQGIIIEDRFFDEARKSVDFIQKHIFPGAGIPSVSRLVAAAADATDMRLLHQEDITPHYPRTLRAWSENLKARKADMLALGYPEYLYRLWQFYFAYCEGGFLERSIGVVQMMYAKPGHRGPAPLGTL